MYIYTLIERRFYVRDGVLQQIGDTILSFSDKEKAHSYRKEIYTFNVMSIPDCTTDTDPFLDKLTILRPNGSKVELEIQQSLVR